MRHLHYIIAIVFFCLITSCEKYLDRNPLDSPSDKTFLSNEAELDMALTACYNTLWFDGGGAIAEPFAMALENATDLSWDRNTSTLQEIGLGLTTSDNGFAADFWSAFYRGIGRCNFIITKSEELSQIIPADKLQKTLAEARFLRAFYYAYLNELFGGVPILKTTIPLAEAQIPRASKEEVVDFILSELDEILPYLYEETSSNNKGRVNKATALSLKARVALYNERWEVAAAASNEVIQMGKYQLENDFSKLFLYEGENSNEIIFAVQYLDGLKVHSLPRLFYSRIALGHSNKVPVQALVDSYECIDGLQIDESPLFDPKKPFENRDPRLTYTVVLPQTRFINYMFETHPDSTKTWNYNTIPATRVDNVEASHAYATFSGYLWRKYADVKDQGGIDNSDLNVTLFRYAEVLLTYAEAKIEMNQIDQSVLDAINSVRQRESVKMPILSMASQSDLRHAVRRERKYELAGEGHRLFDIRRWGIAEQVMQGKLRGRVRDAFLTNAPRVDENGSPFYNNVGNEKDMRVIEIRNFNASRDYLWPIPRLEIDVNPALVQNPNY